MGRQDVDRRSDGDRDTAFTRALLNDLRALERMHEQGLIERGVRRIGAEQELVLVDRHWAPSPLGPEILERITDPRVTTELARFNLECNLDPLPLAGACLTQMEAGLRQVLGVVQQAAADFGATVVLTGILPTLALSDLSSQNITPRPRYFAIDEAVRRIRGGPYELRIKGADDLSVTNESIMLEALNTSFQVHYQVSDQEFPALFNIAQAIAAPTLAAAANSPLLFGKRLWHETRIAIFQQAVETRSNRTPGREGLARVRFGEGWVERSVLEIFRSDVSRFRALIGADVEEDSMAALDEGRIPRLRALQTFNGTVYRWNRPCYGVTDGKPHLRIENRVLPSGPTVLDEVANAALWIGIMAAGPEAMPDVPARLDFHDAAANFVAAAREGLNSQLLWLDGATIPADRLVLDHLLPIACAGLDRVGVDQSDADRYLAIVHDRVASRRTGAQWLLASAAAIRKHGTRAQRLASLTAAISRRQGESAPGHTWPLAEASECGNLAETYRRVDQFMTTDLFTVSESEPLDLVASIMEWEHVRHIPVEDTEQRLVGLVSFRKLLTLLANRRPGDLDRPICARDIMNTQPLTIAPDTTTLDAIALMRRHALSALPVVRDGRLVGIVTEHDILSIASDLLSQALGPPDQNQRPDGGGTPQ